MGGLNKERRGVAEENVGVVSVDDGQVCTIY
jgi:hypothetical protein